MNALLQDVNASHYEDMSPGLMRQRRNLMIISVLMPLYFLSGATIEQIILLGTKIQLQNPSVVSWGLCIFFAYALWRYRQYYLKEPAVQKTWQVFKKDVNTKELAYFDKLIETRKKCFKADFLYPEFRRITTPNSAPENLMPVISDDVKTGWDKRKRIIDMAGMDKRFAELNESRTSLFSEAPSDLEELNKQEAADVLKHWRYIESHHAVSRSGPMFTTEVEYSTLRIRLLRLSVLLGFVSKRTFFSDFQLPFVISLISILVSLWSYWSCLGFEILKLFSSCPC